MSEKDWFVAAAVLLVLFSIGSFGMMGFGGIGSWGGMMRYWGSAAGFGFGWLLPLLCIAVLAASGWLLYKAVRPQGESKDARSVLKMRLARGEITKNEFKELSKVVADDDE